MDRPLESVPQVNSDKYSLIFSTPPQEYRYVYNQFIDLYRLNPSRFAEAFFDQISEMNPKTVRLIAYQLHTAGIDMGTLYKSRTSEERPDFLYALDAFPLESLLVLLKYNFPSVIAGDLFFRPSLESPSNLDWLNFLLNLSLYSGVNINILNQSTGETLLHEQVRKGSLPVVQTLLAYRANPNIASRKGETPFRAALEALNFADAVTTYPQSLNLIRQLSRYGARPKEEDRRIMKQSIYSPKIDQAMIAGATMEPHYADPSRPYFSLDTIEDLSLISEVNPEVIWDANFKELAPQVNPVLLEESIERVRDQTVETNKGVMGWPYYIDASQKIVCPTEYDDRPTAESPPGPTEVYRLALRNLPDGKPATPRSLVVPMGPPPESTWFHAAYYVPEISSVGPTVPLSSNPILPSGAPPLPSI